MNSILKAFISSTFLFLFAILSISFANANEQNKQTSRIANEQHPLVIMSDFGLADGAVSAMKGVAYSVDKKLPIFDLSHDIPPYNIWEAAYRLYQVYNFWEAGTVFVSIIDPGVGTSRGSVVAKSKTGQYFVNPNNGILTLIADNVGIEEIRQIDEKVNRLPNSYDSYTFHGRDVYVYTGARLASGAISFEQVGPKIKLKDIMKLPYEKAKIESNNTITGTIPVLDVNYGNVWTNIPKSIFDKINPKVGQKFKVTISHNEEIVYEGIIPYKNTFGGVKIGEELLYFNSLMEVSFALNEESFANKYGIESGNEWSVTIIAVK